MNLSLEDGSSTASETLVFNHQTTRRSNPQNRDFKFSAVNVSNYAKNVTLTPVSYATPCHVTELRVALSFPT